jgi:hypothetical protein
LNKTIQNTAKNEPGHQAADTASQEERPGRATAPAPERKLKKR